MSTLAERIQTARRNARIAIPAELARRIGVEPAAVYQWESGKTKTLRAETALALADELNVDVRWLVTGKSPKSPPAAGPARVDADLLRQSIVGAERIIRSHRGAGRISDNGRAELISALYDVLAEGVGIDRAENIVAGTLRALADDVKST